MRTGNEGKSSVSVVTELKRVHACTWHNSNPAGSKILREGAHAIRASACTRVCLLFEFRRFYHRVVVLPRTSKRYTRGVLFHELFDGVHDVARVCQVAASGTMCNNSRIHRTVKIYRSKIPQDECRGMKSSQESFGWRDMRDSWEKKKKKREEKLSNRSLGYSRIERRTRTATSRHFFRYLFFQRFMLYYLKLADMNGWRGKVGFVVGYRTMTQRKFRLFRRYFF